jgi:S1-C subfamily serine protease
LNRSTNKRITRNRKFLALVAASASVSLFPFGSANAIIVEDKTNSSGVPVIEPNLYTGLGNQSRFDSVVSFDLNVVSPTGVIGPTRTFGSGVLIAPGLVLTAAHVVDDMTSKGTVISKGVNAEAYPVDSGSAICSV